MYRMPQKQMGSWMVWNCGRSWSYLYANHLPFCLLSNKLKYPGFFYDFSICLITFVKAEFFDVNVSFQKEKLWENVVYNYCVTYLFHSTHTYMQIPLHSTDLFGDKNVAFDFSVACLLGHPVYFDYRDFLSFTSDFSFHILMWKGFEKCC